MRGVTGSGLPQGRWSKVVEKYDQEVQNPEPTIGPPGTRSQIVTYYTREGTLVAYVHQYLRPDGTLGGSGRPKPKVLIEEGIYYWTRSRYD
jgi:hypothetical protein